MPGFQSFSFGGPGGPGRSFHFSTSGFDNDAAQRVFQEFMRSYGGGGMEDDDLFSAFGGSTRSTGSRSSRMRGSPFGASAGGPGAESMPRTARQHTPEVTTVERPLPLTLEELYNGVTKKMKIKRKTFDETGKRQTTDTVLEVPIKPGLKKGSKIKFKGVGDQEEGGHQDLHFIVEEVSFGSALSPPPLLN